MNQEQIIIEAYKLCEEIKNNGKQASLNINANLNRIEIHVSGNCDGVFRTMFSLFAYFDKQYKEYDGYVHIQNFIPEVENFIYNKLIK